jgi:hypothetical protein
MAPGEVRDLDLRVRARSRLGPVAAASSDPDGQQPWFSTTIGLVSCLACATHMCQTPDLSIRPTGSASGGPRLSLSFYLSIYLSTSLSIYLSTACWPGAFWQSARSPLRGRLSVLSNYAVCRDPMIADNGAPRPAGTCPLLQSARFLSRRS